MLGAQAGPLASYSLLKMKTTYSAVVHSAPQHHPAKEKV